MKANLLRIACVLLFVWTMLSVSSQVNTDALPNQVFYEEVHFGTSGKRNQGLDISKSTQQKLDTYMNALLKDKGISLLEAEIIGYSPIEGSYTGNIDISKQHAMVFRQYLDQRYELSKHIPVHVIWVGEDWKGLAEQVRKSDMKDKKQILQIINDVDQFDGREAQLKQIDNGKAYQYMKDHFFGKLNRVTVHIIRKNTPTISDKEITEATERLTEEAERETLLEHEKDNNQQK